MPNLFFVFRVLGNKFKYIESSTRTENYMAGV